MSFTVEPKITDCPDLLSFFRDWQVGPEDLIVTNEYVLSPQLGGRPAPCDVLYQEKYGQGEPSDEMVDAMLTAIRGKAYARIIGIGGGTIMDISKLFVFGGEVTSDDLINRGAELERKSSLVLLPTTCGTGSEVTGIAAIGLTKKDTKVGLAYPALYADEAVLIPTMLSTLPFPVFATSSIDALIHAVESYVSPKATAFTRAIGRRAIELILEGYQAIVKSGKQELPEKMDGFLAASTMAGIAFSNAGCAAVHALSYPIGGVYHVPHGKANYMVFSQVFAAYRRKGADLSPLEDVLETVLDCGRDQVWTALFDLLDSILPCQPLGELGVNEANCAEMAASVVENQQRLLVNNPVELTQDEIKQIYVSCI